VAAISREAEFYTSKGARQLYSAIQIMENSYNVHPNKNKKGAARKQEKEVKNYRHFQRCILKKWPSQTAGELDAAPFCWYTLWASLKRRLFIFFILAHSRREM
jgi:hypothetical protein